MYIYNTTFFIHESRLPEVLHWLKTRFIPETQRDNLLLQPRMLRAITSTDSDEMSYAVQFEADSLADINQWRATIEPPLMQEMSFTFLTAVSTFSTIMEIENINEPYGEADSMNEENKEMVNE